MATLVGQRVFGIALGYEDLNDHDELRHDPVLAVLAGKLEARREDCAPVAGKSTLNRLELSRRGTDALSQDRLRRGGDRGAVRRSVPRGAQAAAGADHPRSRCHRRSAARPPGRPLLPRLLRLLLLSAALRVLRPASAGGQAAAAPTSTPRPARRGGRAHRRPDPRPLAAGAHPAARPTAALPARS